MTRRNWYLSVIAIALVMGAILIGGFFADFMKTLARTDIRTQNQTGVAKVIRSGKEVYGVVEIRSRTGQITYSKAPLGNFKNGSKVDVSCLS